jgi:hypothetical protein
VNTISSPHEIPADVRQVIVRQMALALANAWRRQREGVKGRRPGTERKTPEDRLKSGTRRRGGSRRRVKTGAAKGAAPIR